MRIIAGKYKNRKIEISKRANFRPTKGKIKEALFSMLSSGLFVDDNGKSILEGATTIELFSGSGAYSFEALSRGAKKAIFVDNAQESIELIKKTIKNINIEEEVITIKADATSLPQARIKCDIAFVDPPYKDKSLARSLYSLVQGEWLNSEAIIITEEALKNDTKPNPNFTMLEERIYGNTKLKILKYIK